MQHTLETAPIKVIQGTGSFGELNFIEIIYIDKIKALLGALTGSTIGVMRNYAAIPAAFKTGLNTGAFAFTFFSSFNYSYSSQKLTFS